MSTGSSTESSTGSTAAAWSYRAGPWFAVFGPQVTVLLPPSERDRVVDLWALVDGGGGFDEVLDGLLASGLSKLPGFVLVGASDGPTRVLLRGAGVTATLTAGGEEHALDGGAGATWVERSLDDVTALRIDVPAEDGAAASDADFPVTTGLVRVGRVDRPAYAEPAASAAAAGAETAAPAAGVSDDSLIGDGGAAPVVVPAPVGGPERLEELTPGDLSGEGAPFEAPAGEPLGEETSGEETADEESAEPAADVGPEAADAGIEPDEPAESDEPSPLDDLAVGTSPNESAADDEATEEDARPEWVDDASDVPTDVMPAVGGDPLTDPMPSEEPAPGAAEPPAEPAPDGWVTPYDAPPAAASADDDTVPPPADAPEAPATDIAPPPGWTPPPPPEAPVDAPPPPLGIGSWEPVTGSVPPPPPPAADPDHDGQTVAGASAVPPQPGPSQPAPPSVTAPVAKLLISDGQAIMVDRVVLIGRAPEARRFSSTEQPLLVTVPSRLHEISSTHVEVRPGGGADLGTAVVTDMGSTNGTVLVQPGLGPEDLKPGIAVQLIPGAIINLGDGITIQVTRP